MESGTSRIDKAIKGVLLAIAFALACTAAACSGTSTASPSGPATPPSAPAGTHTGQDDMYLLMAQMNATQSKQLAQSATSKGSTADIRSYAQSVATSSADREAAIQKILDQYKISHDSMSMGRDAYVIKSREQAKMGSATGTKFDELWLRYQQQIMANDVELAHQELKYGQLPQAKEVAQQVIDNAQAQNPEIGRRIAQLPH